MKLPLAAAAVCISVAGMSGPTESLAVNAAEEQQQPDGRPQLEEIIVTAQKRAENVQDIPIAISAFSSDQMESMNVSDMYALEQITPGLITGVQSGNAQTFLRGVGSTLSQVNADSSVATFIDGYYIAAMTGTMQDLYDAERIEVLKGPQAILYGRNASGGAINYVSRKPNAEHLEGKFSLGYGSDDEKEVKGYLTGPLTDTLAFSVSGVGRERDSYLRHATPPPGQDTKEESWASRAKLLWEPVEGYQAELSAGISDSDSFENAAWQGLRGSPMEAELLGGIIGYADTKTVRADNPVYSRTRQKTLFLTQEFEIQNATIRSLSGYANTHARTSVDLDGSDLGLLGANYLPAKSRQYSQEFQVLSDSAQRLRWTAGASYFQASEGMTPVSSQLIIPSQILGLYAETSTSSDLKTRSFAGYLEGSYDVTDKLSLTLGGRWTQEKKEIEDGSVVYKGIPTPSPLFDCGAAGLTFGVDCGGAALGLPDIPPAFVGAGAALNGVVQPVPSESKTWEKMTYKGSIKYAINQDANIYYSHARGFKGGVYNLAVLVPGGPNPPVNPEVLDSNEIGFKGTFFDGRVRLNAAAFIYDVTDAQAQIVGGSGTAELASAGDSELKGGELEVAVSATDRLELHVGVAVLDSEYKNFNTYPALVPAVPGGGVTGAGGNATVSTSVAGGDMVRAPKFTSDLSATYTLPLSTVGLPGTLSMTGVWAHNDGYCFEAACNIRQGSYDVVNTSVSYLTPDERWKVTGWVNNLFDEEYLRQVLQVPTGDLANYQRPRYGGLRVEYRFD